MVAIITNKPYDKLLPISSFLPTVIKPTAPIKPIKMPMVFITVVFVLKIITPSNKVNKGVNEFNMPAKELLIPVSALVNKKAGIKFPNSPIAKKAFQCINKGFFTCLKINGDKKTNAINMRKAATSSLLYTSMPLFINIKELPHISASKINISRLIIFLFTAHNFRRQR